MSTITDQHIAKIRDMRGSKSLEKKPESESDGWLLHEDNAPIHSFLSVSQFLISKNITLIMHPPYSPDLTSCNLFPTVKSCFKRTHFTSFEEIQAKKEKRLKGLLKLSRSRTVTSVGSTECTGLGHQHSLVDAVAFPSYPRHARLKEILRSGCPKKGLKSCKTVHSNTCRMWSGPILLKNKARVLLKVRQQNSSQNVVDVSLCSKLPLMTTKRVWLSKEMTLQNKTSG
ncbi:hypothetical protein TNCV_2341321 [Trichonephila clavipes]|nr:hypothetical protein TNCV_2341321 [Trichonephila clavipes]